MSSSQSILHNKFGLLQVRIGSQRYHSPSKAGMGQTRLGTVKIRVLLDSTVHAGTSGKSCPGDYRPGTSAMFIRNTPCFMTVCINWALFLNYPTGYFPSAR